VTARHALARGLRTAVGLVVPDDRVIGGDRIGPEWEERRNGRDMHDRVAAFGERGLDHIRCTDEIRRVHLRRHGRVHRDNGSRVDHRLAPPDRRRHRIGIGDVTLHDIEPACIDTHLLHERGDLGRSSDQ
jgi:hypothetical protein